jgi:hypothetical protein
MTDPQTIEIPKMQLVIPEPVIDWAYQAYSNLLLAVIESELEGVPAELDNLWTAWGALHDRIWATNFDLVVVMGFINVLAHEKLNEVNYGKKLYAANKTVFAEAIRSKNLRLYLTTRLGIEQVRQTRHLGEQKIQMDYAKGLIEASIEAYNVAVGEFNANIAAIALESDRWKAITAINELELKRLEKDLTNARLDHEIQRGAIRRQRALAGVLREQADVQRLLAEIQLNDARVQAAEIEIQRLYLQALLVGVQQIEIEAQTLSTQVDTEIILAEGEILKVLQASNDQIHEQIDNINKIKDARDAMYQQVIADKEALMAKLGIAENALRAATLELAEKQIDLDLAQIELTKTRELTGDVVEDARTEAGKIVEDSAFNAQNKIQDSRFVAENVVDDASFKADKIVTDAAYMHDKRVEAARELYDNKLSDAQFNHDNVISDAQYAHDKQVSDKESDVTAAIESAVYDYEKAIAQAEFDASTSLADAQDSYNGSVRKAADVVRDAQVKLADAKDDDAYDRKVTQDAGNAYIKENSAKAAALLKSAKVYNRFTEYRQ